MAFNKLFVNFQLHFQLILHDEKLLLEFLSQFMAFSASVVFVAFMLLGIRASYGRYSPSSALFKRLSVPARIAWFLQEIPSFVIPFIAIWQQLKVGIPLVNFIVLLMFETHYFQRSFIYPYLIKGGKPTPIHLFWLGFIFCTWNGYIQGFYHAKYAVYQQSHFPTFDRLLGIPLFLIGMFVNIHSDRILRSLRAPGEKNYKIPRGGMFEFVSGANFFGEIVEWIGYALFAQTQTAWAFAFFTAANTIPRATEHHKWYLENFADYPKDRTAVIPFLY